MTRGTTQRRARTTRGFTLVEIVTSVAISSVLLLALTSVVLLASKAIPANATATDARDGAAGAIDSLLAELASAKNVSVATPTSITFTVPDRTGDGVDDTIAYQWSGAPGGTLQRNFNAAGWTNVSPPLSAFALNYSKRSTTSNVTTSTQIDSGEITLWSWNGWSGSTPSTTFASLSTTAWANQMFQVSLAQAGINRLEITRISLQLKQTSTSGNVLVGVYNESSTGAGTTLGTMVGSQASVAATALSPAGGWVDFTMNGVVFSNASMGELVVQVSSSASSTGNARLTYLSDSVSHPGGPVLLTTSNGGITWLPNSNTTRNSAPMVVYAKYQYPQSSTSAVTTYTLGNFTASATTSDGTRIVQGIEALNEPAIPGP